MAWHLGHALAQTVFTNLYIDKLLSARSAKLEGMTFGNYRRNPDEDFGEGLVEKVLQPYCLSLIKCCGLVNRQVLSEHTYEVGNTQLHDHGES